MTARRWSWPVAAGLVACAPAGEAGPATDPALAAADIVSDQRQHDRRIDFIEFTVTDLPRARAFYQDLFGWTFTDYGPDYSSFADGRITGGLRLAAERPAHGVLVVIYAVDLEAMEARVVAAGGRIVAPVVAFPGGRRFEFEDPEGNRLAVWTDQPTP